MCTNLIFKENVDQFSMGWRFKQHTMLLVCFGSDVKLVHGWICHAMPVENMLQIVEKWADLNIDNGCHK